MSLNPVQEEIQKSSLNIRDGITAFYCGNYDQYEKTLAIAKKVEERFSNFEPLALSEQSRHKQYTGVMEIHRKEMETNMGYDWYHETLPIQTNFFFPFHMTHTINAIMCYPLIKVIGNKEQRNYFLPRMESEEIRTCYAQTELGHGSDVQNIETTATYDPKTKEFILNSPTVSSAKWWPGELGYTANWACVFAQLITQGKNQGVHTFMVPLRDNQSNRPLPGVEVGDIGPKVDYKTKDNGFLRLYNVRVPRNSLLMKYFEVKEDGTYIKKGNEKTMYTGMMAARIYIIGTCFSVTSRALIIAMRYSINRKQFKNEQGQERKLLDYQLQQHKLFGAMANIHAMFMGYVAITKLYKRHLFAAANEDYSMMNEVHLNMSGAKSLYTFWSMTAIETCRRACGGLGFHDYSGIPIVLRTFMPNTTLEGDNVVMLMQTARILLSSLKKSMDSKPIPESVSYLKQEPKPMSDLLKTKDSFRNVPLLVEVFNNCASHCVRVAASKVMEGSASYDGNFKESWDKYAGTFLYTAGKIHMIAFTMKAMLDGVSLFRNEYNKTAYLRICSLFGANQLLKNASLFYEAGILTSDCIAAAEALLEDLLAEIRPDAASWTEAYGFPDSLVSTAIGKRDKDPYEEMMRMVREHAQFNQTDVESMVKEHIFPLRNLRPRI